MYEPLAAPATIGGVLDSGFSLLKASFRQIFPVALIPSIIGLLPSSLMQSSLEDGVGVLTFFAVIASAIISMWTFGAVVMRMDAVAHNRPMTTGVALSEGFRRAPRLLLVGILYALAVGLGTFALLIPGLILAVTMWFGPYLVAVDNQKTIASLSYSHKLVWGYWWRTAAIMLVATFITFVSYLLVVIVAGIAVVSSDGEVTTTILVMQSILEVVITVIIFPITTALTLAVLHDLKLRREGEDLERRIDNLATE